MRAASLGLILASLVAAPLVAGEPDEPPVAVIVAPDADRAPRNRETRDLRARIDERAHFLLRQKQLHREIQLAIAELDSCRRVARQYGRFSRFINDGGFLITREQLHLDLVAAELRLQSLRDEQRLLNQQHQDHRRLNHLLAEESRENTAIAIGVAARKVIIVGVSGEHPREDADLEPGSRIIIIRPR